MDRERPQTDLANSTWADVWMYEPPVPDRLVTILVEASVEVLYSHDNNVAHTRVLALSVPSPTAIGAPISFVAWQGRTVKRGKCARDVEGKGRRGGKCAG